MNGLLVLIVGAVLVGVVACAAFETWGPIVVGVLVVAVPLLVVVTGQSTADDSPESLAIAGFVILGIPLIVGGLLGAGGRAAWTLHRGKPHGPIV